VAQAVFAAAGIHLMPTAPRRQHVKLMRSDFGEDGITDTAKEYWAKTKKVWRAAQTAKFWTGTTLVPPVPDGIIYGAGAFIVYKVINGFFGSGGWGSMIIGSWDSAKNLAFAAALPSNEVSFFQNKTGLDLATFILQQAQAAGVSPAILYGLGHLESGWGTQLDSNFTGDNGHGHGYLQIDDGSWADWLANNNWQDPVVNVQKGLSILLDYYNQLQAKLSGLSIPQLIQVALAAYNAGPGRVASAVSKALTAGTDPVVAANAVTYGGDYLTDLIPATQRVGGYA
jgi:hypothetical protein